MRVFDLPIVKTQKFRVHMEGNPATFFVERKEVTRQQHNMICTDGMEEGQESVSVDYDIWQDVEPLLQEKIIKAVENEVEQYEKLKQKRVGKD